MHAPGIFSRPLVASAVNRLLILLASTAKLVAIAPPDVYRPEAHYMRGPGPKWREKHASLDRS